MLNNSNSTVLAAMHDKISLFVLHPLNIRSTSSAEVWTLKMRGRHIYRTQLELYLLIPNTGYRNRRSIYQDTRIKVFDDTSIIYIKGPFLRLKHTT